MIQRRRLITPAVVRVELCTDAKKNISHGRLEFSGFNGVSLLATRRSSSVLLLGPVRNGVAMLVKIGLLCVPCSRRGTGGGYTTTSAAHISSARNEEYHDFQLRRTKRRTVWSGIRCTAASSDASVTVSTDTDTSMVASQELPGGGEAFR